MSEPAAPALVADLHVHYPMHVLSGDRHVTLERMVRVRPREGVGNKARGAILWVASRLLNYRSWDAGPRVTADFLAAGGVRVGLSVLYSPFDEMDLDEPYGAPPESACLKVSGPMLHVRSFTPRTHMLGLLGLMGLGS